MLVLGGCKATFNSESTSSAINTGISAGYYNFMYMTQVKSKSVEDTVCFYKFKISSSTISELEKYWNRQNKVDKILAIVKESSEQTVGGNAYSFSELSKVLSRDVPPSLRRKQTFSENVLQTILWKKSMLPASQGVRNTLEDVKKYPQYLGYLDDEDLKILYAAKDKIANFGPCPKPNDSSLMEAKRAAAEAIADSSLTDN